MGRPAATPWTWGCGAGVYAVWMAKHGMQVTGIDMFAEAIAMGRAMAEREGVDVRFVHGDLFGYDPGVPYDLVLDSGCLHSLVGGNVGSYKRALLRWLADDGEFVLAHWGKRHGVDWRPIGPKRRSAAAIERLFGDELELVDSVHRDFEAPLPFGPVVRGSSYRFARRNRP